MMKFPMSLTGGHNSPSQGKSAHPGTGAIDSWTDLFFEDAYPHPSPRKVSAYQNS